MTGRLTAATARYGQRHERHQVRDLVSGNASPLLMIEFVRKRLIRQPEGNTPGQCAPQAGTKLARLREREHQHVHHALFDMRAKAEAVVQEATDHALTSVGPPDSFALRCRTWCHAPTQAHRRRIPVVGTPDRWWRGRFPSVEPNNRHSPGGGRSRNPSARCGVAGVTGRRGLERGRRRVLSTGDSHTPQHDERKDEHPHNGALT